LPLKALGRTRTLRSAAKFAKKGLPAFGVLRLVCSNIAESIRLRVKTADHRFSGKPATASLNLSRFRKNSKTPMQKNPGKLPNGERLIPHVLHRTASALQTQNAEMPKQNVSVRLDEPRGNELRKSFLYHVIVGTKRFSQDLSVRLQSVSSGSRNKIDFGELYFLLDDAS
jgi:hypothetical protein